MKAYLYNYRQSPRKTRLVANMIRGKRVPEALVQLEFLTKRAGSVFAKLINSAVANAAHNNKVAQDKLFIKEVQVNKGLNMKRIRPRSRGMANRINKRTSNITLVLGEK